MLGSTPSPCAGGGRGRNLHGRRDPAAEITWSQGRAAGVSLCVAVEWFQFDFFFFFPLLFFLSGGLGLVLSGEMQSQGGFCVL